MHDTCADLGTCYLKPQDELCQRLVELLAEQNILQVWTDTAHEFNVDSLLLTVNKRSPIYIASSGGDRVASALISGISAAEQINLQMQRQLLLGYSFLDKLVEPK